MAMTNSSSASKRTEHLDPSVSRIAGAASALLGLAGVGALLCFLIVAEGLAMPTTIAVVFEMVLLGLVAAAGVQLLLNQVWAQRFLLGFWLAVLVLVTIALIGDLLSGAATWWSRTPPGSSVAVGGAGGSQVPAWWGILPPTGSVAVLLVPAAAAAILLIRASRVGT
ncbi:MAG TPA: hypothetical protein VMZ50_14425, partial [Phycisphaerae bacterium]|nr:hypothetical protein [Phycisphaerae bacterium]